MLKKYGWIFAVLGIVAISLVLLGSRKQVTIYRDGEPMTVITNAMTVGNALQSMGIVYHSEDAILPPVQTWLKSNMDIYIESARPVHIVIQPGNTWLHLYSAERQVGALLDQAGII